MGGGIYAPPAVVNSWPRPNYSNPPTTGWALVIVCAVFGFLSVSTVAARLFVRGVLQRRLGIDDLLILFAMVPAIGMVVLLCITSQVDYFDRHIWDIPPKYFISERKLVWVIEILYVWATGLIKVSILFFYRRLTKPANMTAFLYVIWAGMASVVVYMGVFTVMLITECAPIQAIWLQVDPAWSRSNAWSCTNEAAGTLAATIVSTVQDLMATMLPLWLFWVIDLPIRQKIALGCIFACGYLLVGIGAVRIYLVYRIFYQTYDVTWQGNCLFIWTAVETLAATICASLPALRVLFGDYFRDRRHFTYTYASSTWSDDAMRLHGSGNNSVRQSDGHWNAEDAMYPPGSTDPGPAQTYPRGEADGALDSPTLGTVAQRNAEMSYFGDALLQRAALERAAAQAQMGANLYAMVDDPVAHTGDTQKAGRILGF